MVFGKHTDSAVTEIDAVVWQRAGEGVGEYAAKPRQQRPISELTFSAWQ